MKIVTFGLTEIKPGKHNLKDPRLDQAHKLIEADKKTNAQVDVMGDDQLLEADAILATHDSKADLILKDLEFVETRLGRDPHGEVRDPHFCHRGLQAEVAGILLDQRGDIVEPVLGHGEIGGKIR